MKNAVGLRLVLEVGAVPSILSNISKCSKTYISIKGNPKKRVSICRKELTDERT